MCNQVAALQNRKAAAVNAEDYDEAKRLKAAIDRRALLALSNFETRSASALRALRVLRREGTTVSAARRGLHGDSGAIQVLVSGRLPLGDMPVG